MLTGQGALAYSLMHRCGIKIDREKHDAAYKFLKKGTGQNGYVWYGEEVGGPPDGWADMGRTGASGIANFLSPYDEPVYRERAMANAKVIGLHPQSFPDTHGSPPMGMASGDVLMNEGGDFDKLGRGYVWEGQIDPCITQNHVFAVRPHSVDSWWLNSITSSDYAQFYFMSQSKQSTNLASISSTNLMELPVILPPANEQTEILRFVHDTTEQFDGLISEAERGIELLQERRTALISAAVTGKIDVRGFGHREDS